LTDSIQTPVPQSKAAARFLERLAHHNPATAQRLADLATNGSARRAQQAPPPTSSTTRRAKPPRSKRAAPAQHARARKATRAQRTERRRLRELQRDDRILDRVTQKIHDAGGTIPRHDIMRIPSAVWRTTAQIIADASGRAARIYLARMPSRAVAGAVLRAATENGQAWADLRARRICALGVALDLLSKRTRRRGPWSRLVIGITRGAFAALLADPFDQRSQAKPSLNACFGVHRLGAAEDADSNQIGYYRALQRTGATYRQQIGQHSRDTLAPCERGFPSGHSPSRYWLAGEAHEQDDDEHRERLEGWHIAANTDADDLDLEDAERRTRAREHERPPPLD